MTEAPRTGNEGVRKEGTRGKIPFFKRMDGGKEEGKGDALSGIQDCKDGSV